MMRIRMRTLASGPAGQFYPGQVYEVSDATGLAWVGGGYADLLPVTVVDPETDDPRTDGASDTATEEVPSLGELQARILAEVADVASNDTVSEEALVAEDDVAEDDADWLTDNHAVVAAANNPDGDRADDRDTSSWARRARRHLTGG